MIVSHKTSDLLGPKLLLVVLHSMFVGEPPDDRKSRCCSSCSAAEQARLFGYCSSESRCRHYVETSLGAAMAARTDRKQEADLEARVNQAHVLLDGVVEGWARHPAAPQHRHGLLTATPMVDQLPPGQHVGLVEEAAGVCGSLLHFHNCSAAIPVPPTQHFLAGGGTWGVCGGGEGGLHTAHGPAA